MVLGLSDGAGGEKGGGVGGGGGEELQQRHGRLKNDTEATSRAWKCLLLWRISILGGAFEREEAKKTKKHGGGRVFKRFRSHIILKYTPAMR